MLVLHGSSCGLLLSKILFVSFSVSFSQIEGMSLSDETLHSLNMGVELCFAHYPKGVVSLKHGIDAEYACVFNEAIAPLFPFRGRKLCHVQTGRVCFAQRACDAIMVGLVYLNNVEIGAKA